MKVIFQVKSILRNIQLVHFSRSKRYDFFMSICFRNNFVSLNKSTNLQCLVFFPFFLHCFSLSFVFFLYFLHWFSLLFSSVPILPQYHLFWSYGQAGQFSSRGPRGETSLCLTAVSVPNHRPFPCHCFSLLRVFSHRY